VENGWIETLKTFHSKPTRASIFPTRTTKSPSCEYTYKVSISTFPAEKRARAQPHGLLSAHNAKLKPFLRLLTTVAN